MEGVSQVGNPMCWCLQHQRDNMWMCADHGGVPLRGKSWFGSLGRDIVTLGQHPVFVLNLIAYCPIQGAFGAYTFWGPKASTAPLALTLASCSTLMQWEWAAAHASLAASKGISATMDESCDP